MMLYLTIIGCLLIVAGVVFVWLSSRAGGTEGRTRIRVAIFQADLPLSAFVLALGVALVLVPLAVERGWLGL